MNLNDLKKPFPANKISWRVGSVSKDKKKAMALAYLDARDVMDRLDEVCGPGNWQNKHPHANGKTSCAIGIKIGDEWVWKENGAGDSQVEAEKGAFSDAFKRSAVMWGVGRYLYDVPNIWVEIDEYKQIKNLNDPRLAKALEAAEKGIRLANEPEIKPIDENELKIIQDAIFKSNTLDELKIAGEKAIAAKPRMNEEQQKAIRDQIKGRENFLKTPPPVKETTTYLQA